MTGLMEIVSIWNMLFWLVVFVLLLGCSAVEDFVVALGVIVLSFFIAFWVFGQNVLGWAYENPGTTLIGVVAYLGLGVLWSFFKWDRLCSNEARKWKEAKEALKNQNTGYSQEVMQRQVASLAKPPEVFDYKGKFTSWIILWPFSVIVFVFDDMFAWVRDMFLEMFGKVYQAIANRHFKDN